MGHKNDKSRFLEEDFRDPVGKVDIMQNVVGNVDNNLRKNNLRLKRLKEGMEVDKPPDVLIGFLDWSMKSRVLDALWDKPKPVVEGQELAFYSDLCPITVKK